MLLGGDDPGLSAFADDVEITRKSRIAVEEWIRRVLVMLSSSPQESFRIFESKNVGSDTQLCL